MITTITEAQRVLTEAVLDAIDDHGEQGAQDAYRDLVEYVAEQCDSDTRAELLRREGYDW